MYMFEIFSILFWRIMKNANLKRVCSIVVDASSKTNLKTSKRVSHPILTGIIKFSTMDNVLEVLSSLTSKKRVTTYKKIASPIPDGDDDVDGDLLSNNMGAPPALTGNGFLFGNATLNRVKNRLEGIDVPEDDRQIKDNENEDAVSTQLIANLYDGGEDLEETKSMGDNASLKDGIAAFTQTQRIPVSIQSENVVDVPIHSINQGKSARIIRDDDFFSTAAQTQKIIPATARIIPVATQRIHSRDTASQTQQVPFTKPIEPQTQIIETTANDSDTQPLRIPVLTAEASLLFQTTPDCVPTIRMDPPSQTEHDKYKTQLDTMTQTAHDEGKTQVDTMPQTIHDDVSHTLKIRELQSELALEDSKREKARNVEYKKSRRNIPTMINFSKESFLADFDNSSSDEGTDVQLEKSQLKQQQDDNEVHENKPSEPNSVKNSRESYKNVPLLSSYANNLKREIDSSKCIILDLDSDSDDDGDDYMGGNMSIKDESALPISRLSKATILNLKARLSKQSQNLTQMPNKNKGAKVDHNKLFNILRKASRKQILDHQREVIETKGFKLEDMAKEKEIVENLLEQEILRNRRIRQKEKEKEKLENEDSGSDSGSESSKFEMSDNEIANYELSSSESENNKNSDDEQKEEEEEEEDIVLNKKKSYHVKHVINESDSEIETEQKMKVSKQFDATPKRNAIDLGHYGDNIDEEASNSFEEDTTLNTQKIDNIIIKTHTIENREEEEVENDSIDEEISEAIRRELIDKKKSQLRQKEKKHVAELKEFKSKGITNFFEMEAEESEDEWHGVGGADGEGSEEYDSEVEKMIDDYSKNSFNSHEIREMLAAENKEMDVKMINKILYDIKNGGFRNKRAKNSLELELSDDEDDVLQQYRLKRRELMRKRRLEIGDDTKLVKNPKSKAFFESMVEDIMEFKNPFKAEEESHQDLTSTATDLDTQDNDSIQIGDSTKNNEHRRVDDRSKKTIISEDFVQKSLSFLRSNNYDEFEMDKERARIQHDIGDEGVEDLFTLKQHSSIKSFTNSPTDSLSSKRVNSMIDLEQPTEDNNEVENEDPSLIGGFKHPSIIKSFASRTDINDKFKEGNKTVKISKTYKTVGSSKASITYMGKTRKLMAPKKKADRDHHHNHHSKAWKTQKSKLFESGQDSFDS
ncbi:hypothetical protein SKDZ_03G0100 [Saccharomyces kudriavzevii ZP591]|nr:hypothetical protein SKDZ_03G0100 [Saccharomyces kudriavzevii ZP591]